MKKQSISREDFGDWPLPAEILTELGRISAAWVGLESILNLILGKLSGFDDAMDPIPLMLFTHASFPQRLDTLGSLCEHLAAGHPSLKDRSRVIGKLRTAQTSRNRYMHNGITFDPESGAYHTGRASSRGKLKTTVEEIRIADLKSCAIEIWEAEADLYRMVFGRELSAPWKQKPGDLAGYSK